MRDEPNIQSLIGMANSQLQELTEEQKNFAPIFNSKLMLDRILRNSQGVEKIDNLQEVNVGLLAAKALDSLDSDAINNYAQLLHAIWNLFFSHGQLFDRPTSEPEATVYDFFDNQGIPKDHIRNYFDAIKFTENEKKKIAKIPITAGSSIYQWKGDSRLIDQGNWYSDQRSKPDCLGINPKQQDISGNIWQRKQVEYAPVKEILVLKSIANDVWDTWSVKWGQCQPYPYRAQGGCVQYFNKKDRKDIQLKNFRPRVFTHSFSKI